MLRTVAAACLLLPLLLPATAHHEPDDAARALRWLGQDDEEGAPFQGWSAKHVVEAAAQVGRDPKRWPSGGHNVWDHLQANTSDGAKAVLDRQRVAHAIAVSGYDPRDFRGRDLVEEIRTDFDGVQTGSPTAINDDIWAIIALRAADVPPDDQQIRMAVETIKNAQTPAGGWYYDATWPTPGSDMTGMALVALRQAGALDGETGNSARGFLDSTYDDASGGHRDTPSPGHEPNCQSTLWALHGYAALGDPLREESQQFLHDLQNPDGGFRTSALPAASNSYCTAEAIPILAGSPHPWPHFTAATVQAPQELHVGDEGTFRFSGPDAMQVRWDLPDRRASGTEVQHAFDEVGAPRWHMRATSDDHIVRHSGWVEVPNRPPTFVDLPQALTATRLEPVQLRFEAVDPDGHAVQVAWELADQSGRVPASVRLQELGSYDLLLSARDGHGGDVQATLPVTVVNLPPRLQGVRVPTSLPAGEVFSFQADAVDPDGSEPQVAWHFGKTVLAGAKGSHALAAGTWDVRIVVTDQDGAAVEQGVKIRVSEEQADTDRPPVSTNASERGLPVAPTVRVENMSSTRTPAGLVVEADVWPSDAQATIWWVSPAGNGSLPFHDAVVLPLHAPWADLVLRAHRGDASAEGRLHVDLAEQDSGVSADADPSASLLERPVPGLGLWMVVIALAAGLTCTIRRRGTPPG